MPALSQEEVAREMEWVAWIMSDPRQSPDRLRRARELWAIGHAVLALRRLDVPEDEATRITFALDGGGRPVPRLFSDLAEISAAIDLPEMPPEALAKLHEARDMM